MEALVEEVRHFLEGRGPVQWSADANLVNWGFADGGEPVMFMGSDVAVDLGHPSLVSRSIVLATEEAALVRPGRISLVGPDLGQMSVGEKRSFAQILLVATDGAADPLAIDVVRTLGYRLPGWVVRVMPGRLWARVRKAEWQRGLGFEVVGTALNKALGEVPGVVAAEVFFVTSSAADVRALESLGVRADAAAGRWRRLSLGADGELECEELDCNTCEEQPVCDTLREVVSIRRRQSE
ncbi:MAG: hypothetical protein HN348_16580 [Proteobacteria bacterium]|jgi:CO dehydrogenase/acetyl-CoA synthase beta subunit|nr:hypothetical protein [Pseudomonadota bacterium]